MEMKAIEPVAMPMKVADSGPISISWPPMDGPGPETRPVPEGTRRVKVAVDAGWDNARNRPAYEVEECPVHHEPMTVADLILALQQHPPGALVIVGSGDACEGFAKAVDGERDGKPIRAHLTHAVSHMGGDAETVWRDGDGRGELVEARAAVVITPYPFWHEQD